MGNPIIHQQYENNKDAIQFHKMVQYRMGVLRTIRNGATSTTASE